MEGITGLGFRRSSPNPGAAGSAAGASERVSAVRGRVGPTEGGPVASIALFHSVLGIRRGITDAAELLRAAGHEVRVVDQYDGRTFDDYAEASRFAEGIGFPALMQGAVEAVADMADGFLCIGFSNGGGMSEHVAQVRVVRGVVLCSGALPLPVLGAEAWPAGVPAQLHCSVGDPFRRPGWPEQVVEAVRAAGGAAELFEYPGRGHLFTDADRADEYDASSARLLWQRVLAFCAEHG
ncbi:dienelactone hydrolase family protein [Amnibacterium sp. CER49]|uniref:dienelactone hydrolase family protein n=1 Tax=Amnibacterium sp. CER49 TaxID=3039161 RepID=UPI00244BFB96|nr:dienelactone hydrolase family protein [Amnibacterium sp. CER49]MDH2443607.1 dienelactone hydrolase family protein [Amnibacterium sp. CER49]